MKYLSGVSAIRTICTLAVIGIHVTSTYVPASNTAYAYNQLFRFAVPLFILLSGISTYYSDLHRPKSTPFFYLQRFYKIFFPYLLWTLIYMLYDAGNPLVKIQTLPFWQDYLNNILNGYEHLYFLLIIAQIYLLYPLLKAAFNSERQRKILLLSTFIITAYFQLAVYLFTWDILLLPYYNRYYIYFPAWIFFFVLGMDCAIKTRKGKNILRIKAIPTAILWSVAYILLIVEGYITDTYGSSIKPSVMLYTVLSFFLMLHIFHNINKYTLFARCFKWMSAQSFMIYLCHILVLKLLRLTTDSYGISSLWHGTNGMWLLFISTTILSTLVAYIFNMFTNLLKPISLKEL